MGGSEGAEADDVEELRLRARRIGHDLGNAVGVIANYGAVLAMTLTEEPAAKYLGEMRAAADRVAALTREVLELGAQAERAAPALQPEHRPPPRTSVPSGLRVLVADDDAMNRRLARLMLEKAGYEVDVVANGAEAVEAIARGGYAAVLMDCEMAVMDGYAAATEIRRREASSGGRIPIVAVTANALGGEEDRGRDAGMDAHVTKPYDIDHLEATLAALIEARR